MPVNPAVARARALLGVPFKLHGRGEDGLDCVGLVALVTGRLEGLPTGYAMRNDLGERWIRELDARGRRRFDGRYSTGDILLMEAGPAQYHLGCWTGEGLIHADARLRRVVELPGPPPWPIIGAWHFS
jgi:murein DD-endopeptidase / murein LD-carboxypeptidase